MKDPGKYLVYEIMYAMIADIDEFTTDSKGIVELNPLESFQDAFYRQYIEPQNRNDNRSNLAFNYFTLT